MLALAAIAAGVSPAVARADWTWPVRGEVIRVYDNGSDPYAAGRHRGIDIGAPVGEPVVAATGGSVTFAGTVGASGRTVNVVGTDGRHELSYLHLSEVAVREGQAIRAGDRLGAVGTTGVRSSSASHLHFGVRVAGSRHDYLDPLGFLPARPPASEPRRPAAPVAVPAPPHVTPAPVPVATPRAPAAQPAPRSPRVPAQMPDRARAPGPIAAPHSTLGALPAAPTATSEPARAGSVERTREAWQQPDLGSAPSSSLVSLASPTLDPVASARQAPASRRSASAPEPPRGIDLGWLAAFVGCVLGAIALGRPDASIAAAARSRAALGALLRPLTGRG